MAGLHVPLPTLRQPPRGCLRTARGRCGSLHLHRNGLAPSTPCRSPGALKLLLPPRQSRGNSQLISTSAGLSTGCRVLHARSARIPPGMPKNSLRNNDFNQKEYRMKTQFVVAGFLLTGGLMAAAGQAAAADSGGYIGFGVGQSKAALDANDVNSSLAAAGFGAVTTVEDTDFGFKFYGGFHL